VACGKHEFFVLELIREREFQFYYLKHHSQSDTHFEPRDRLIHKGAGHGADTFYAVRHTCFMNMIFEEAVKFTNGDLFAEYLVYGLSTIYGKMKCLDILFGVKADCAPPNNKRSCFTWQDLMKDKDYMERKQKFSDCMAGHLSKQSGVSLVEAYEVVGKIMSEYEKSPGSLMGKINKMLIDLKLPNWLDRGIRHPYRSASLFFSPADRAYTLTSKYCDDSRQIHLHILSTAREVYELNLDQNVY
jgi:hypothetical protein